MSESGVDRPLPEPMRLPMAFVGVTGAIVLAYLVPTAVWNATTVLEMGLLAVLMVAAGAFPLPVARGVRMEVTPAVTFSAVLVLDPAMAALSGAVGVLGSFVVTAARTRTTAVDAHEYAFNTGSVALHVGLASTTFHALTTDGGLSGHAVAAAALVSYGTRAALVIFVARWSSNIGRFRVWWRAAQQDGPAEIGLLCLGLVGAVAYRESPQTIVLLALPVALVYLAFSRLVDTTGRLDAAERDLEDLQGDVFNSAKLASVGAMSLDLAHQVKIPLSTVLGQLQRLQLRTDGDDPRRSHLEAAVDAGRRIHQLTENFTTMAQHERERVDVPQVLGEAFRMAELSTKANVRPKWSYQLGLPVVSGNPVLLREAFANLLANAMDAIEADGVIQINVARDGEAIVTGISDNGPGIPPEVMAHLFEPFHSTKRDGMGLGLFAARHILELGGGSLDIESPRGHGTTATVRLPVWRHEDARDGENSLSTARLGSGR